MAMHSFENAEALVGRLHGCALRLLASHADQHYTGIAQASRSLPLSGRMRKKLQRLDSAFAVLRHITEPYVEHFLADLEAELTCIPGLGAKVSTCPTACPSSPIPSPTSRPDVFFLDDGEAVSEEIETSLWRIPVEAADQGGCGEHVVEHCGPGGRPCWADLVDTDPSDADEPHVLDPVEVPVITSSVAESSADASEEDLEDEQVESRDEYLEHEHEVLTDTEPMSVEALIAKNEEMLKRLPHYRPEDTKHMSVEALLAHNAEAQQRLNLLISQLSS